METIRMVMYHTKDILKGRAWKVFGAFFGFSLLMTLYMEASQLLMDVTDMTFVILNISLNIVNTILTYVLLFIFIKAVRNEKWSKMDVVYGVSKFPKLFFCCIFISALQIGSYGVCLFISKLQLLYIIVSAILYVFFVIWNCVIAFAIYDDASFADVIFSVFRIMKDHISEIIIASFCFMFWYICSQWLMPYVFYNLLGSALYKGMVLSSFVKGMENGILMGIGFMSVNLLYYAIQYICLIPLYTYLAKLYNDNRALYAPSAKRTLLQVNSKLE